MDDNRFEQMRHLGAKYWQRFVTAVAAILACTKISHDISNNSPKLQTAVVLVSALIVIVGIRFPRVAIRLTRWILGQPPLPPNLPRIFRGPLPYFDGEQLPGRAAEINSCWLMMKRQPFFILEGESGCGKTSILNAALIPQARERFRVVECRIAVDPVGKLVAALQQVPYQQATQSDTQAELGEAISKAKTTYMTAPDKSDLPKPLLICIDQFEELFVTVKDTVRCRFLVALKKAIANSEARLLIAVRNDFRDLLLGLCRNVDEEQEAINLCIYYKLPAFTSRQAKAVLSELLEPVHKQDPLRQQQLDDFSTRLTQELLLPPRDRRLFQEDEKTVLPVDLQTVGLMIESVGIENFSVQGIVRLGGKAGLFRAYIEEAKSYVWRKTGVSGDQSLLILRQLISPARTKWARTAPVIGKTLSLTAAQVESVLKAFAEKFLVNQLPPEDSAGGKQLGAALRYELMHEHLVNILVEAPQSILQRARDAEERLQFWRKRTEGLFSLHTTNTSRFAPAQPIPSVEMFRLWRFATTDELKRMLRRNLRGFFFRLFFLLVLPISLALVGWGFWTRSDTYQIQQIVQRAPVARIVAIKEAGEWTIKDGERIPSSTSVWKEGESWNVYDFSVVEWAKALILVGHTDEAFAALRNIKDSSDRSQGFMATAITLSKVNDLPVAKKALEISLVDEQETWWHGIHSDGVAAFVEAAAKAGPYDQASIFNPIKGDSNRARAFAAVATGLFRAGKADEAGKVFDEAIMIANHISKESYRNEPLEERADVLARIAEEAMGDKRTNDAVKALNNAIESACDVNFREKNSGERFDLLFTIASGFAKAGDASGAERAMHEVFASGWSGWDSHDGNKAKDIVELLAAAGKSQGVLTLAHNSQLKTSKQGLLVASAIGLAKFGDVDNTLAIVEEIKDPNNKLDALVSSSYELLNKNEIEGANRLANRFLSLQSQATSNEVPSDIYKLLSKLVKSGQRDVAVRIGQFYEKRFASDPKRTWDLRNGRGLSGFNENSPLSETAAALIELGNIDDGLSFTREVQGVYSKYYILANAAAALIKLSHYEQAKKLEAEMLGLRPTGSTSFIVDMALSQPNEPLLNIAVEWANAGKVDEARSLLQETVGEIFRYIAFEPLIEKLVQSGKLQEALDTANSLKDEDRSKALADIVLQVIKEKKGEQAQAILPLIQYPDDQSRARAAIAQWQARNGFIRPARLTSDSCSTPSDQIEAYTTILIEYAKRRRPDLSKEFEKEMPSSSE